MAVAPRVRQRRIIRDERIHGGEPVIAGTRVPVRAIVVSWREYQSVRTLLEAYPRLSEADIHQALEFYEAHREELDAIIQAQLADD